MNKSLMLTTLFISTTCFLSFTLIQDAPQLFLVGLLIATLTLAILSHRCKWLKLDDRQLFKQPLFILTTAYPAYLFIFFGAWAWRGYSPELSSTGYAKFLEISKFPLIILASSVPLGAIVNNIHRTIQTEKQIDDAGLKNRNDIYYGHVKFILDQFDKIKGTEIDYSYKIINREEVANAKNKKTIIYKSTPDAKTYKIKSIISIRQSMELYRKIFKMASSKRESSFEVSEDFLSKLSAEWLEINDLYKQVRERNPDQPFAARQEKLIKAYSDIDITYTRICNLLCLCGHHSKYSFAIQDRAAAWQWYSTFSEGRHIYDSIRSLAAVTGLILDRVRDENVDKVFPSNQSVFIMGSGVVESLAMHFDTICVGRYQPPTLTGTGAHWVEGISHDAKVSPSSTSS